MECFPASVFKDRRAEPAYNGYSVDDCLFQIEAARFLADLDPESVSIVVYNDEGEPIYRLAICTLDEAEIIQFRRPDGDS